MPNRILRDFTDSENIDGLDVNAERFFVRLIMKVDDYGRYYANEQLLKSSLFPLKTDIRITDISRWVTACEQSGLITTYEVANKRYLEIMNFNQQLRIKKSKFPESQSIKNDDQMHSRCIADDTLKRNEVETETNIPNGVDSPKGETVLSDKIDFKRFIEFINNKTGREFKTVNDSVKKKYNARLKEGYTKEDILNAISNAVNNEYHKQNDYQYLTPEFFSRSETIEKYSSKTTQVKSISSPNNTITGPWNC